MATRKTTKKQIKLSADRYKSAWKEVMGTYPKWKKDMLLEDMQTEKTSSQLRDFIKKVLKLAESKENQPIQMEEPISPSRVKAVRRKRTRKKQE